MAEGKLLIFGGTGFVGGHLATLAAKRYEVVVVGRGEAPTGTSPDTYRRCDPGDPEAVNKLVDTEKPVAVVNTAAISAIDYAEVYRDEAHRANVSAAEAIAAATKEAGARHVFLSSDAVFSGEAPGYGEEDTPAPVNYYGETKAQAESAVLAACPDAAIIRVSLILGFPVAGSGGFVAGLAEKAAAGTRVSAPDFEYRSPIDVATLCEVILELLERKDAPGIWHVAATEAASRFELSRWLVRALGASEGLVERQSRPPEDPARAPRHKNGVLSVGKAQRLLRTPMPSLEKTIERAVATRQNNT
jgi:dTDP-4-dehydrorhamnose reductase